MRSRAPEGTVTLMAAAGSREPARDLYQLLGVAKNATREEIALAWRRRARDEHPDARQGDADAPARFRVLAEAWQVLGDPGRRASYDRGLDSGHPPGRVQVTVRRPAAAPDSDTAGSTAPPPGPFRPPLVAGPVRVERGSRQSPGAGAWDEEDSRLALLAELVLRYRGRGRPW